MDIQLLKNLGNLGQIAGIREAELLKGREKGVRIAEFYNAAGLRFTVVPDRAMDLYEFSFRGINLSFQTKNGLTAPSFCLPGSGEFAESWPGGMMVTCGLDNVGGYCETGGNHPAHGRIGAIPALTGGTETVWEGDDYILRAFGETHQTRFYGMHLSLRRTIETGLWDKSVRIHDILQNHTEREEPYMLLYHFNFGYPLLKEGSRTAVSPSASRTGCLAEDWDRIPAPVDGKKEELRYSTGFGRTAAGVIWNEEMELGAYVRFDTETLPNLTEWKRAKAHDYVFALEPTNTVGLNRLKSDEEGLTARLAPYGQAETFLELGVLEGLGEIREFVKNL